ncbi:hypothetical protein [Streptomyces formicae]|uniref:Uncharacterized protein n=1 Tax=Streptomyces formicae TaxID=1616117 RepID=A0ABY3WHN1_9ACTN|nr:hypothetical protein [Streptomyces formicae]UNM12093.1 hypothetical protein J4032_11575 [Streptomyces formicae]
MPLLERSPNNASVDAVLRQFEVNPATVGSLPLIDPNHIDPSQWAVLTDLLPLMGWGVIGRYRTMSYDFGPPRGLGRAVANTLSNPVSREIGGEETIGTETTFSISSTVEAGFFDMVKASVTSSFSQTWSSSTTFKDYLTIPIPPGYMSWLELRPVMRWLSGHFVHVRNHWNGGRVRTRFSGDVVAPGLEGTLQDVIVLREAPIPQAQAEVLKAAANRSDALQESDGAIMLPASFAALEWGEHANSTDVTDKVRAR